MNLGQLVGLLGDLEQLHRAPIPAAPAPCAPRGVVTHRARGEGLEESTAGRFMPGAPLAKRVRAVLAASAEPMTAVQVQALLSDEHVVAVRAELQKAAAAGDVQRTVRNRVFHFASAAKGPSEPAS